MGASDSPFFDVVSILIHGIQIGRNRNTCVGNAWYDLSVMVLVLSNCWYVFGVD